MDNTKQKEWGKKPEQQLPQNQLLVSFRGAYIVPNEVVCSDGWLVKHMHWNPLGVGNISPVNIGFCAVCANFLAFEVSFLNFAIVDVFGTSFASTSVVVGEKWHVFRASLAKKSKHLLSLIFLCAIQCIEKKKL